MIENAALNLQRYIAYKGNASRNTMYKIASQCLELEGLGTLHPMYNLVYRMALGGCLEYYNKRWHLAPQSILYKKQKDSVSFVGVNLSDNLLSQLNLPNMPIVKWAGSVADISLIDEKILVDKDKVILVLKKLPKVSIKDFTCECNIYENSMFRKNQPFKGQKGVYQQQDKPYLKYIFDGNDWRKIYDVSINIDSQFWARLFDDSFNNIPIGNYRNNILKLKPQTTPISLGRLLFIASKSDYSSIFKDSYSFELDSCYVREAERITGGKIEYI